MENLFDHTSCIILSAGSSERMGMHKALLKFDNNHTFLSKIAETYAKVGVEQILFVVNAELLSILNEKIQNLPKKVLFVLNDNPGLGRFYSLQSGVQNLIKNNHCFFQNIDNPLVTEKVLESLLKHKNEADVLIPIFENRPGHPVLFSSHVTQEIMNRVEPGMRIDYFLKRLNTKRIELSDKSIVVNINSQEDYLAAGFRF
ncbi:MAG: nucleotidyltransferase family protein [Bacteroidales bacterium]